MKELIFILVCFALVIPCLARTITVDDDGPADFSTIQAAINDANDGDTILVADGTYTGTGNRDIDFKGKAITVRSENGPQNCIINCGYNHRGFYFHKGEDANSVVSGFTITGGYYSAGFGGGISCIGSSPTIKNNIVRTNSVIGEDPEFAICSGGGIYCRNSSAIITNNVISNNWVTGNGGGIFAQDSSLSLINNIITANTAWAALGFFSSPGMGGGIHSSNSSLIIINNTISDNFAEELYGEGPGEGGGICCWNSDLILINTILWNNDPEEIQLNGGSTIDITYSDVQGGWPGVGNINSNPRIVTPGDPIDLLMGDYHLKSQAGRWNPVSQSWVKDSVTSPCIDAGDPNSDWTAELWPNGKRINMGAYGGTSQASMSLSTVGNTADIDNNDAINFMDYAKLAKSWQNEEFLLAEDFDRNGVVDYNDLAIFAENWLYDALPILTDTDIILELEYLETINTYPENLNIDPNDYPIILGRYSENWLVLIEKYFCSDVCPVYGRVILVYEDITSAEECAQIGGVAVIDPAWGSYIGCAPDVE